MQGFLQVPFPTFVRGPLSDTLRSFGSNVGPRHPFMVDVLHGAKMRERLVHACPSAVNLTEGHRSPQALQLTIPSRTLKVCSQALDP